MMMIMVTVDVVVVEGKITVMILSERQCAREKTARCAMSVSFEFPSQRYSIFHGYFVTLRSSAFTELS